MVKYGVVIPARNEVQSIAITIKSLHKQTLKPRIIVVVDDSSTDGTSEVAKSLGAYVVRIQRSSSVSAVGTPYLAFVINEGFKVLEAEELDFIMVSGAECLFPKKYVEELTKRMIRDECVVASGIAIGEYSAPLTGVRGAGRMIFVPWFKSIGFRYPLNYGFEAWLIFKALAQGLKVRVYNDLKFYILRRTGMNISKAYFYGKAMKALGYSPIYTLLRILRLALSSNIKFSKYMLLGYIKCSNQRLYQDIKPYINSILIRSLIKRFLYRSWGSL